MKKITLLFLCLVAFQFGNAQDTCATAIPVTVGATVNVAAVNGTELPDPVCAANGAGATYGEWYSYTATIDGIANITSQTGSTPATGDTRVHIYEGSCGSLTCLSGNDDIDPSVGVENYLSSATFPVTNGTTYIIAWDDRWSAAGFDFVITETPVDCSTTSPYSYDFSDINPLIACYSIEDSNTDGTSWGYNNGNDFDGDTVNDGVGLIFPPNPTVTKDDWLFLPVFNGIANAEYSVTVVYNSFNNPVTASESFDIVVLDEASSTAVSQTVIGSYSGITQSGVLGDTGGNDMITQAYSSTATYTPTVDGDFYFAIHATTPMANSGILILFNISANETLSVNEFSTSTFSHSYNKDTDNLKLESSNLPFNGIELYNILGQNVLTKTLNNTSEVINMSNLKDGVYLAKVNIEGQVQTVKLIKH